MKPCLDERVGSECIHSLKDVCDACGTSGNYFGFFLDDLCDELFHKIEAIQDGRSGHRVAFKAPSKEEAIRIMNKRLNDFYLKEIYACDEDGSKIEERSVLNHTTTQSVAPAVSQPSTQIAG